MMPSHNFVVGLDLGSTTIKVTIVDTSNRKILFSAYERHDGYPVATLLMQMERFANSYPNTKIAVAMTGSQSADIAKTLNIPFVQEVIAGAIAVRERYPEAETVIELGGQDAKIIFFSGEKDNKSVSDMRMNGVCAGGTGAFLDQIATLISIPIEEFNNAARKGKTLYTISGRCGVFAKTDIQPLINQGVSKNDIALSCMHALVKQTIGGLAQGMEIKKPVVFAGGTIFFNNKLVDVFKKRLELSDRDAILPQNAQTLISEGTALSIETNLGKNAEFLKISDFIGMLKKYLANDSQNSTNDSEPFFSSDNDKEEFFKRHKQQKFNRKKFPKNSIIDIHIGIDAGSTTTKFVALDENEDIIYKFYNNNMGDPLETLRKGLIKFYEIYSKEDVTFNVVSLGTTGYGEMLFAKALGADYHTVETIAHKEAACSIEPKTSFILDLGGQDMKAIFMENGIITNIVLNEACSAGCGSFIESYSNSIKIAPQDIAKKAFRASAPSVLGSRCTVFMNSSIISEQKNGKTPDDILAGLCRSVIENLFTKVVRVGNLNELGDKIVVQGGTFKNDAVLRAFEQYIGKKVIRPQHSGAMGALGIALLAKNKTSGTSSFIGFNKLYNFGYEIIDGDTCPFCNNHCKRRIVKFSEGSSFVTGNRCERGEIIGTPYDTRTKELLKKKRPVEEVPDLLKERLKLIEENYVKPLVPSKIREKIGIPLVLDFYDSLPFWKTFFTVLGYEVVLSDKSSDKLFEEGLKNIPSDTVCLPAKIAHGHIISLISKKVETIFFPKMLKNIKENKRSEDSWNCAVLQGYPEIIRISEFGDKKKNIEVRYLTPSFKWTDEKLKQRQLVEFTNATFGVQKKKIVRAIKIANKAQKKLRDKLLARGAEVLDKLKKTNSVGVLIAGRPYHGDPFINHNVSEFFTKQGIPVLVNEAIPELSTDKLDYSRIDTINSFHTRMISAAKYAAQNPNLELVQLVSFGCGHDAVLTDEVERILKNYSDKVLLTLKLDEGENSGPLNIRIKSFIETVKSKREEENIDTLKIAEVPYQKKFLKKDKKQRKILIPNLSESFNAVISAVYTKQGYSIAKMPPATKESVALAKKYVHNDICYPAQINIGEILSFLNSNKKGTTKYAAGIAKNCADCRAGHYAALARKALDNKGYSNVPIITTDINDRRHMHPGFKINQISFTIDMAKGLTLIDALDDMLRKCRPYEKNKGESYTLYKKHLYKIVKTATKSWNNALKELSLAIDDFNSIQTDRTYRKPRVGIIGEILVNYHNTGNFELVEYLESNGMEVVLPAMKEFWRQDVINHEHMASKKHVRKAPLYKLSSLAQDKFFKFWLNKTEKVMEKFKYYEPHTDIREIANNAAKVVDISFRTGEGWLIPGEIMTWIEKGITSFLIVQPFGCLPNHITGRGVIKAIKKQHPSVNILPLDFDPDTSIANIHNRLQMIILNASS